MPTNLRQAFATPFILGLYLVSIHAGVALWQEGWSLQWFGALLSALPLVVLLTTMVSFRVARTSSLMPLRMGISGIGALVARAGAASEPLAPVAVAYACAVGLVLSPTYVFWYSRLPSSEGVLAVGEPLPAVQFLGLDEQPVSSDAVARPGLWMFFRGNWCPLCMAQIREIAGMYRELSERGVTVALVSGQPAGHTRFLAKAHGVDFTYLRDPGYVAAKTLGLFHEGAVPAGIAPAMSFDDGDAYLPTVAIVDRDGIVRWLGETDNYRVRPEPETFLAALDELGI